MSKGSILIYTSAAGQAAPLPGVTLTVTDAGGSVRARLVTDADGFAEVADLPAPDAAYSLDAANTTVQPYALYRIEAALDGWQPLVLNGVPVFCRFLTIHKSPSKRRSLDVLRIAVWHRHSCLLFVRRGIPKWERNGQARRYEGAPAVSAFTGLCLFAERTAPSYPLFRGRGAVPSARCRPHSPSGCRCSPRPDGRER